MRASQRSTVCHRSGIGSTSSVLTTIFILSCLTIASGQRGTSPQPKPEYKWHDTQMFRGRLISVGFDSTNTVVLHFMLEESFALPTGPPGPPRVWPVKTVWKADLGTINESNYVEAVESLFPPDIHLGGSCFVITEWPALGLELRELIPNTTGARETFLARHREFILDYRKRQIATWCLGKLQHIRARNEQIRIVNVRLSERHLGPEERVALQNSIGDSLAAFSRDCGPALTEVTERLAACRQQSEAAPDDLDRASAQQSLPDLESALTEIKQLCEAAEAMRPHDQGDVP